MMKHLLLIATVFSNLTYAAELTRYTAQKLHQAQQLHADGDLTQAINLLMEVESNRSYDQSMVARSLGVYYWQEGQAEQAIRSLRLAISSKGLQPKLLRETQLMLADLYFNQSTYQLANDLYYSLIKTASEGEELNRLWLKVAKVHYQLMDWDDALIAVSNTQPKTTSERVEVLTIRVSAQLKLHQWPRAENSLQALLVLEPENSLWWKQLVSVQLKQGKTRSALTTLSVAKHQYSLSDEESRLYSQLLAKHGVPAQAAVEIEQLDHSELSVEQLVLLATLWERAREWDKSVALWLQVAEQDSQYYMTVVRIYMQQRQFSKALQTINKVPVQDSEVLLLRAQIAHKLEKNDAALSYALRADKLKSTTNTQSWVEYLTNLKKQARADSSPMSNKKEGS